MAALLSTIPATKGDRTRQRLLHLAVQRFAADGYRRTSVSDIARAAGLTPAAVYAYFDNKEALFRAAVDADAAALLERAQAGSNALPVREAWFATFAHLREMVHEHPLARRVLAGLEPGVASQLLELQSLKEVRAALTAALAHGQETGEIRTDIDPAAVALGLETLVLSLLMAEIQFGQDPERIPAVYAVLDAAVRA